MRVLRPPPRGEAAIYRLSFHSPSQTGVNALMDAHAREPGIHTHRP